MPSLLPPSTPPLLPIGQSTERFRPMMAWIGHRERVEAVLAMAQANLGLLVEAAERGEAPLGVLIVPLELALTDVLFSDETRGTWSTFLTRLSMTPWRRWGGGPVGARA